MTDFVYEKWMQEFVKCFWSAVTCRRFSFAVGVIRTKSGDKSPHSKSRPSLVRCLRGSYRRETL